MLHASYQSHIGTDGYIAPDARPDDGVIWLLVIRAGASRSQLLQVKSLIIINNNKLKRNGKNVCVVHSSRLQFYSIFHIICIF